jgi:hypothetical protein
MFEPNKVTLDKYFFRGDNPLQLNKSEEQKNQAIEDEGDANTSRNLKTDNMDRRVTCEPLTLKENLNRIDGVEHHPGGIEDNKIAPDVHIYNNNFVDRKNMTQEITIDNREVYENELNPKRVPSTNYEITLMDYESLPFQDMLQYDTRSFSRYLLENLVRRTLVISIPLKHSYLDPVYIRIAKLTFATSLIFGLNAMLVGSYIERQTISARVNK